MDDLLPPGIRLPPQYDPDDFYYEGGVMVFTAKYLLKRGACCRCGCRHCPYDESGRPLPQFAEADHSG